MKPTSNGKKIPKCVNIWAGGKVCLWYPDWSGFLFLMGSSFDINLFVLNAITDYIYIDDFTIALLKTYYWYDSLEAFGIIIHRIMYIKIPGTAALNEETMTNNNLTQVGDQPTYSAMPPITPAIMRLFCERCNFANLAKSNTSLI